MLNGEIYHMRLDLERYLLEIAGLRKENDILKHRVTALVQENENLKQCKWDAPIYCACGCGEIVEQPKTGRTRKYVNDTHKKRVARTRKKQVSGT